MGFQRRHVVTQLTEGLGVQPAELVQRQCVADAGDDVLALRVGQVVAVHTAPAGGRVAGEGDAAAGVGAEIAEHHGLHVDRGAEAVRDVLTSAVQPCALGVPRLEDGQHRALQLLGR